ncbi:MAG: GGDEF domain-containing protein [Pseudomonas sp.]
MAVTDLAAMGPGVMRPQGQASGVFARLMLVVSVVAGLSHTGFIFLFQHVGVPVLALANVASVLIYVLAAILIQRGRLNTATLLVATEVLVHGVVATAMIGWDAGFHHYIVLILPFAVVSAYYRISVRIALAVAVSLGYMGLDYLYRQAAPAVAVPAPLLGTLHYINLATMLGIMAVLASTYYRLVRHSERRLHELACTDPLTQLRNRRFMMEVVQHEAAVFERGGRPLSILLGDVDHFKRINDEHGHAVGDAVLRAIARVLREGVREVDHVARWGGEEFLVLLPGTELDEAQQVAERLRAAVQTLVEVEGRRELGLSITLGMAELQAGESIEQALVRADRALYEGKQTGRNRVVPAGQG